MEFDLKSFVENYIKALRESDSGKLIDLISSLSTEEDRVKALDGVIIAIEKDKDLLNESPKMLEVLDSIRKEMALTKKDASAETAVLSPSMVEAPVDTEAPVPA